MSVLNRPSGLYGKVLGWRCRYGRSSCKVNSPTRIMVGRRPMWSNKPALPTKVDCVQGSVRGILWLRVIGWHWDTPTVLVYICRLGISFRRARWPTRVPGLYLESPNPSDNSRLRFAVRAGGFTGYNKSWKPTRYTRFLTRRAAEDSCTRFVSGID